MSDLIPYLGPAVAFLILTYLLHDAHQREKRELRADVARLRADNARLVRLVRGGVVVSLDERRAR